MKTTAFLALLVLGLLVAQLVPDAQPRRRIPLVGVLTPYATPTAVTPHRDLEAFVQGLRQLGYVEGQTIHLEYRFAAHQSDRYHLKNSRLEVHALPGCHNEGKWA